LVERGSRARARDFVEVVRQRPCLAEPVLDAAGRSASIVAGADARGQRRDWDMPPCY